MSKTGPKDLHYLLVPHAARWGECVACLHRFAQDESRTALGKKNSALAFALNRIVVHSKARLCANCSKKPLHMLLESITDHSTLIRELKDDDDINEHKDDEKRETIGKNFYSNSSNTRHQLSRRRNNHHSGTKDSATSPPTPENIHLVPFI